MGSHKVQRLHLRAMLMVLAICGILLVWTPLIAAQEPNLIQNGSFEQSRRSWFTGVSQSGTRATVDTGVAYEGAASFSMSSTGTGGSTSVTQDITLPGTGTYQLSGAVRTDGLVPNVTERNGAVLTLSFGNESISLAWNEDLGGAWETFEHYITIPAGVTSVRLKLQLSQAQGSVWWDALRLEHISDSFSVVQARATVHPAGTVLLNWSLPAGMDDRQMTYQVYRSETPAVATDAGPLATLHDASMVDRNTRPGITYYYGIVPVSAASGRGEPSKTISATVESIEPSTEATGRLYADWDESTDVAMVTWTLGEDVRAGHLQLERGTYADGALSWTHVADLPSYVANYEEPLPKSLATPDLHYRLTIVDPEGDVSTQMQTTLEGIVPRAVGALEPGVHPRLFISSDEIEDLKDAADANPAFRILLNNEIVLPAVQIVAKYAAGITLPPKGVNGPHWELAKDARAAALGYVFTGNEAYAKVAREILLAYAKQYKQNPLLGPADGRMTKQTRDEAVWITDMAWAYDLTWNSPQWTDEERRLLKEEFFLDAAAIIHPRGSNAWRTTLNAGVGAVAFLFGDEHWIHETIYGDEGFVYMMGEWNREDGLSWLHSISHHNANRERLTTFAEMAYRSGYDLYGVEVRGKSLKLMFDAALYHAFSNGKHPVVGHAQPTEALAFDWTFAAAYRRYKDPRYAELWRQTKKFVSMEFTVPSVIYLPDLYDADQNAKLTVAFGNFAPQGYNVAGSTHFADTGMAVLRGSGIDPHGPEVAFLYKPYGVMVGHQTPDNLSIMMAGDGDHWLPGPGQFHYSQSPPEHGSWYRHTVARNGVVVDETSQYPQGITNNIYPLDREKSSAGRMLNFIALPGLSAVRGEANTVYQGVELQRTVVVRAPYMLDRYVVQSSSPHQYDWVIHVNGAERSISLDEVAQLGTLGTRAGHQHIDTLRRSETEGNWQASWERDDGRLGLTMLGGTPTTVYRAEGFGPSLSRRPMLVARRHASATEFVAVLELFDDNPVVERLTALEEPGVGGVVVERKDTDAPDVLAWRTTASDSVAQIEAGRFDGEMAFFAAQDGTGVRSMAVLGGTYVAAHGVEASVAQAADVAVEWSTSELLAVSQRSDADQTVTLTVEGGDGSYRGFVLGVTDTVLLQGPVTATEVALEQTVTEHGVALSWQATSGAVYVIAKEAPDAEWLSRYVVEMNVGSR